MHRSMGWVCALGAVTTLALGVAGCGSDSESADGGFTGREADINETLVGIQEDFVEIDGESYCSRLTAAGQRQVQRFGKAFALGDDCVKIIDTAAKNARATGVKQKPTKLISVKFNGDRAVATIRNGGRPPQTITLVNDQGDWKIPNPGFSTKIGGDINAKPLSDDPTKRFQQVKRTRDTVKGQTTNGQ